MPNGARKEAAAAMNKSECKGCTQRRVGCHAHCEKYAEWRAELDKINACIRRERQKDSYVIDAKRESLNKQANHYKNLGFRNPTNK